MRRNPKFWVICPNCEGEGSYRNDVIIGDHLENILSDDPCKMCCETGYIRRGWAHHDKSTNITTLVPGKFDDYEVVHLNPSPPRTDVHKKYLRRGVFLTWVDQHKFSRMRDNAEMREDMEGSVGDVFTI